MKDRRRPTYHTARAGLRAHDDASLAHVLTSALTTYTRHHGDALRGWRVLHVGATIDACAAWAKVSREAWRRAEQGACTPTLARILGALQRPDRPVRGVARVHA